MKKRIIAFLLCFALVMPILPTFAVATEDLTLSATSVTLPQYEKKTITAAPGANVQVSAYQWQIKVPGTDLWVDISGAEGDTLELSYAMIASLLQGDQAQIRCEAVIGGATVETDVVTVTMDYTSEPAVETESEPVKPQVLTEAAVVESSVSAPASDAKQEETIEEGADLAALEEARNAAIAAENAAEAAVTAAQEKLTAAQTAEAAAKAALDQAQAEYDAAVAAAAPAETEAEDPTGESTEAAPAVTVDSTALDAAKAAYADAQAVTAAAQKKLDEANAALTAAQATTTAAQQAYEAATPATATFNVTKRARRASNAVMMADAFEVAETEPPKKVNIIINYVFTNGEVAAQPYVAQIGEGSDFYAVVKMPTVTGYLPYEGENAQSTDSVTLSYANVDSDKTVTVTYKPTNVNYTVKYFLQNENGAGYTEDKDSMKIMQGLTGSTVVVEEKEFTGFKMQWYDSPAIAADGSTVVEVYYERQFYLMLFELDGGYGVEPIYARYESNISVGTPTKAGYTFKGWSQDRTTIVTLPTKMPAENRTYKAIWEAATTAKVTVVFWGETADCTDEAKEYDYYGSGSLDANVGSQYTYGNEVLACATEEHTHTDECIDCGLEEHTHTVENGCYVLNCAKTSHDHSDSGCTINCAHTHTTSCYRTGNYNFYSLTETSKPGRELTDTGNGIYTYTYRGQTHYYVNIGEKWYCAESGSFGGGSTTQITYVCSHTHGDACYTCGQTEGTHIHSVEGGCYIINCDKESHTHTNGCNGCGKAEHTHTSNCTINISTLMPSNLWTQVKSETKTVAPDGTTVVNVYYDRTEFTLTFKGSSNYGGTSKTYGVITDKWGADIEDRFFDICKTAYETAGTYSWSEKTSGDSPWTCYVGIMPQENRTYYAYDASGTMTAYYYFQTLDGEYNDEEGNVLTVKAEGSGFTVTDEDRAEFEGFTHDPSISTNNGSFFNGAKFYYTRNSYVLDFNNGVDVVSTNTVKYQAPLSTYKDFKPNPPATYEPGSVEFAGWYLNAECTGDKYILENHTMPAANLILYAKWTPVNHDVNVYLSKDVMNGSGETLQDTVTVAHGSFVPEENRPATPTNGNLKFVGWFYMDGDTEKAFDFANMPIRKDLNIYAVWTDDTVVDYTVFYFEANEDGTLKKDENGNNIPVADQTTGSAMANTPRTFEAKASEDLYKDYQEGFFPNVKSHSVVLSADTDNEWIFAYIPAPAVPYKVYYKIIASDGTEYPAILNEDGSEYVKEVNNNKKAVVTENFVVVPGYMPDAYQKRLVVTIGGDNTITFYYHEDNEHAYYMLSHHTQNLDGTTYTEVSSSQAVGDVGTEYSAQPQDIPGFTYVETKTEIVVGESTTKGTSHVLTTDGLEIKHYYDRNAYPYIVRYLEAETNKELAPEKTKDAEGKNLTGLYGEVVSENMIDIEGYTCISPAAQTLTIRIEKDTKLEYNIITFYYQEKEVKINYEVVGPTGCGTVDLNDQDAATVAAVKVTEEFKAASGSPVGATAEATSNVYKFEGWYLDAACNQPVNTDWVNADDSIVPVKHEAGWPDVTTYYAKFVWNKTHMTLKKVVNGDVYDTGDSFIFKVSDADGTVLTTVSLQDGGSVVIDGLTVGESYTITEIGGGSNRYNADESEQTITLVANPDNNASKNVVTFTNTLSNNKWLTATDVKHNVFG